jgi:hypothetical protein
VEHQKVRSQNWQQHTPFAELTTTSTVEMFSDHPNGKR